MLRKGSCLLRMGPVPRGTGLFCIMRLLLWGRAL